MPDNPYAPPNSTPQPDHSFSEVTAAGSRIDVRPRDRFNGQFLRSTSRGVLRHLVLIAVMFPFLLLSLFVPPEIMLLMPLIVVLGPISVIVLPLRAFWENVPARQRFVDSLEAEGSPVEFSFEPRLPCEPDEACDTADDLGVLRLDDEGLHFHGDHIDCEVRICDLLGARARWELGTASPKVTVDFCDELTHNRVVIFFLHGRLTAPWRAHCSARDLAARINTYQRKA
jgi:hypothetical protein